MKYFLTRNATLLAILAVAAILRFWQLGNNPPALFTDEVSNGYNAYSILKTARDEHGNFLPLTFKAFGDYNLAFSVYTLVPGVAVFGLSEFAVRFPSALLGTLTVPLMYLLVKRLGKFSSAIAGSNEMLPLLAAFFMAISPWHLQFSRYDHEANFMLFFSILAVFLLITSFKNSKLLPLSAISFAIALNTYHGAKIWIPCLLLLVLLIYGNEIRKFKSKLILPIIILLISILPILLNIRQSAIRGQSVGILKEEKPVQTFISNYLSHFSFNFLFVEGDNIPRHAVSGMGELYVFQLPLIILGLLALIKQKGQAKGLILGWLLLAAVPPAVATPAPHALRAIMFAPIWAVISAFGLLSLISSKINSLQKTLIFLILSSIALYNILTYLHLYYKHYPKLRARDWQDGYRQMIDFVDPIKDKYVTVAMTNFYSHPYIFILFYTKFDPTNYQNLTDKSKIGNYEFFGKSWEKTVPGTALVIRPEWQKPDPPPRYIKEIKDTGGQVIFRISEEQ